MAKEVRLSTILDAIDEAIADSFSLRQFTLVAEITDVRKNSDKEWCFFKFIEKENETIIGEVRGTVWSKKYSQITYFERVTRQPFANGIEIKCNVKVCYHKRYGLSLEILSIDMNFALGVVELQRQKTMERLLADNPEKVAFVKGEYQTFNNLLPLPLVIQKIALITAHDSDGRQDFMSELQENQFTYHFSVQEFLVLMQGNEASQLILQQLKRIEKLGFDAVVITRGGGSETDFSPFEDYELAKHVAGFPIPILTGIGHDRNTTIVDLMARRFKTPTRLASFIVDHNSAFEDRINELGEGFLQSAEFFIDSAKESIRELKRIVTLLSPETVVKRGYAMVYMQGKIITDPQKLTVGGEIETLLQNQIITSEITKKNGKRNDL